MAGALNVTAVNRYELVARWIRDDLPVGASVCELGAAPGDQIAALSDRGYVATAVDIGIGSDGWSDGEDGRMVALLAAHDVRYVQWDLERTPYPMDDAAFDAVLMTEVFEHLRDYPVRSLEEAARMLRPGGWLYFTTPNAAYVRNRWQALRGRNPVASSLPDWIGGLPHARHAREYTFGEIDDLLSRTGFQVVRRQSRHFHAGKGSAVQRLAKRLISIVAKARPELGPSILITGRKS